MENFIFVHYAYLCLQLNGIINLNKSNKGMADFKAASIGVGSVAKATR
jgi:hypothetical protein